MAEFHYKLWQLSLSVDRTYYQKSAELGINVKTNCYNSRMELERFVEAVSKSQLSMVERIVDLEKGLITLSNSVTKLVEVLAGNPTKDKSKVSKHYGEADGFEYVR